MKNVIGAALIIIGIALVLMQTGQQEPVGPAIDERNEELAPPPDIEPEGETQIRIQPILGIVAILGGAAILIYAYNQRRTMD